MLCTTRLDERATAAWSIDLFVVSLPAWVYLYARPRGAGRIAIHGVRFQARMARIESRTILVFRVYERFGSGSATLVFAIVCLFLKYVSAMLLIRVLITGFCGLCEGAPFFSGSAEKS